MENPKDGQLKCPYEKILQYYSSERKYYVKLIGKKYADSIYLTEDELCKFSEGKSMLNKFLRSKNENSDKNHPYNPNYDKVEAILLYENQKYLVLWCDLGFNNLTWEDDVDKKAINLFNKRLQFQFPEKKEDVTLPPKTALDYVKSYGSLSSPDIVTLNKIIANYNKKQDFVIRENMGLSSQKSCISFLRILQTQAEEHGPYLIVSNSKSWYDELKKKSEILPISYDISDESCEKIREMYLSNEKIEQLPFHAIVVSLERFEHDIQFISMINYRVAIFHSNKSQQIYKKYHSLQVGMNICINVIDIFRNAQQIHNLFSSFMSTKENIKMFENDETEITDDILTKITPAFNRRIKHGDSNFIAPPITYIDCPMSEIQKKLSRSILAEYLKSPPTIIEKILRICTHPFLVTSGELNLESPNLVQASTKLLVLNHIIRQNRLETKKILVISQYQQMIELIIDMLDEDEKTYVELSSDFEIQSSIELPSIYLYNPKNGISTVPIENIKCVVILDGNTQVWNEMLISHRSSRTPIFDVTNVYFLECRGCCERELLLMSESSINNKQRIETIINTISIHIFSDFKVPGPNEILLSGVQDDNDSNLPIFHYIQNSNFSPKINAEILYGIAPEKLPNNETEHVWTIHERNLLTRSIFRFGVNRWKAIQQICGLFLPIAEIESAAASLIKHLLRAAGSSAFQPIRNYIKSYEEKKGIQDFDSDSVFNIDSYLNELHQNATILLKRLEFIIHLDNSLGGSDDIKPEQVPLYKYGGASLTDWWTENYDVALAYLSWKFGLGVFDHIGEYPNDRFCVLINRMPEFIEYKRLTERTLKLIDIVKKTPLNDQKVIDYLSQISCKTSSSSEEDDSEEESESEEISQEAKASVISQILKFGIHEDRKGNLDYDRLANQVKSDKDDKELISKFAKSILKKCKDPEANGISIIMGQRVITRVNAMSSLRKLLKDKEDFIQKIESAKKWRNLPKKWTPEVEYHYFRAIEECGFGDLKSIFDKNHFQNIFENGNIPFFLLTDDEAIKRIFLLDGREEIAHTKKVSQTTSSRPSSKPSSKSKKSAPTKKTIQSIGKKLKLPNLKELQKGVKYPFAVTQQSEILCLGEIVSDRPDFHTERYIYPAGYKSTRQFFSLKKPNKRITWISEIIDNGGPKPLFRIYPENDPKSYIEGETPSYPWSTLLKKISELRKEKKSNTISGPEAFLLTHPSTIYLIQHLPGAKECSKYIFRPIQGEDD